MSSCLACHLLGYHHVGVANLVEVSFDIESTKKNHGSCESGGPPRKDRETRSTFLVTALYIVYCFGFR